MRYDDDDDDDDDDDECPISYLLKTFQIFQDPGPPSGYARVIKLLKIARSVAGKHQSTNPPLQNVSVSLEYTVGLLSTVLYYST